jgi:aminoglycoside 3-N-acetyltransferase
MISNLKRRAKHNGQVVARAIVNTFFSWTPKELIAALRRVGIRQNDVVLVHCSFDGLKGFKGSASDVITALQTVVGDGGTILMPNQPFLGSAISYVNSGRAFDVRRTPSQMGLVSEIFRRSPGVLRSVHPTHPVAAWGAGARELIADHHAATTPCGKGTPYTRFAERNGKILFLGTNFEVMTYFHCLEEELEPFMPKSPFTQETFEIRSKNEQGEWVVTRTRLFDPEMSRKRNLLPLGRELVESGALRQTRVGLAPIMAIDADQVARLCRNRARQGCFFYDN